MAKQTTPGPAMHACDGRDFKRLMRAGMAWLERNYETVNALNVFPVPDGDTGTNMLLTIRSACKEVETVDEAHLGQVAQKVYNGALMGARGNSGVILSQLLRGFARAVEKESALDDAVLLRGFQEAVRMAYQAVQEPVEGTMLTVAREASEECAAAIEAGDDMLGILDRVVARCRDSVQRTPLLLKVLADAGVVDSGGAGLMYILEGMQRDLHGEALDMTPEAAATRSLQSALTPEDEEGYGYDVQFLLKGDNLDVAQVRADIESMGWSTLVVGDEHLIKVHVHVHNPGIPLGYAAEKGNVADIVVENMQEQYQEFVQERGAPGTGQPEAVQPPHVEHGHIAAVTVAPGEGLMRIFYSLGAGRVISGGQTMNPSTKDFIEAIEQMDTDKFIILPNNKNILMAAEQAAQQVMETHSDRQVRVVPTKTVPQGVSALLSLDPRGELEEVAGAMQEGAGMVETGEVTTATRNVKIDGLSVKKGQIIGLHNDHLVVAGDDVSSVVLDLLHKMGIDALELVTLYYGADVVPGEAEVLAEHLQETYPDHEIEIREGGQAHYFYILSAE